MWLKIYAVFISWITASYCHAQRILKSLVTKKCLTEIKIKLQIYHFCSIWCQSNFIVYLEGDSPLLIFKGHVTACFLKCFLSNRVEYQVVSDCPLALKTDSVRARPWWMHTQRQLFFFPFCVLEVMYFSGWEIMDCLWTQMGLGQAPIVFLYLPRVTWAEVGTVCGLDPLRCPREQMLSVWFCSD